MSNLLKQHFVINLGNEKRIINSDDKYVSNNHVSDVNSETNYTNSVAGDASDSEEIIDGFLAGLEAEQVAIEPQIDVEEILAEARAEADAILAQAKAEAMKITDDAKREANLLFEQQKAAGFNMGVASLQAEIESQKAKLQEEFQMKEQSVQADFESRLDTMEADIVDALISVFNKVFHIQFEDKRDILLHLIKSTLLNVEVGKEFHIRVSGSNHPFVESHIGEIKEKIGNDINIEIVNDMTLGPDDCIIETEYGVFNCGIDMELSNLEKDIRSLCR